jgi:hypothetical protein
MIFRVLSACGGAAGFPDMGADTVVILEDPVSEDHKERFQGAPDQALFICYPHQEGTACVFYR